MLPLIDFDEMAAIMGLEKTDISDYPALEALQRSVYAALEEHTGRTFERGEYSESVYVDGHIVSLPALPVVSVKTVQSAAGVDLPFEIMPDGIRLRGWHRGYVSVTYTGGFDRAPENLRRAALLQTMHEFQRKDHIGAESVSTDGGFARWPQLKLLDEVKACVSRLVHPARFA
ncbi:MAG: hypothetical protein RBR77_04150 [Thauera sp.]|jgi:hypothetical protein|nr:hypothetical protein [Thauera sp.]